MNKITTVIFAHGDAINTVNVHLPIWKSNTDNLLIVSPNNNACIVNGIDCLTYEGRQHHGPLSLKRQMFAMNAAMLYDSDYYVFLEYDALLLKKPKNRNIIQCNVWNEHVLLQKDQTAMDEWKCFLHFPWIFPKKELIEFLKVVTLDENDETPQDVWLAQQIMKHDFKIYNLMGVKTGVWEGYSRNSFDTVELVNNAIQHVQNGAYALHGIKTKDVFDKIISASKNL